MNDKLARGAALVAILAALVALMVGFMGLKLPEAGVLPPIGEGGPAPLATAISSCAVHTEQGCARFVVESGGEIEILSGGTLDVQTGATVGIPATTFGGTQTLAAGAKLDTAEGTGEGVVFAAFINTTYSVTTTGQITIPANADVVDWSFVVSTAYDDSGTDLMTCGSVADADRYVDDLDLSSAGRNLALDANDMQLDESTWGDVGASALAVQCIYTGQNGNASAGVGKFIIWYRLD